jgi:hypothetical protein
MGKSYQVKGSVAVPKAMQAGREGPSRNKCHIK